MKYFYDTEFLEDGRTIDLISIGIVAEDGREYYAVAADAPWDRIAAHPWLRDNVVPSLPVLPMADGRLRFSPKHPHGQAVKLRADIADEVCDFLLADGSPELWADYGAYDHVVLCQLWGRMIDLPAGLPMWTHDLRQLVEECGNIEVPEQEEGVHNALADARHVRVVHRWLTYVLGRP